MVTEEKVVYAGAFSSQEENGQQDDCAKEVGVPREMKRATLDNFQALLDDDGVHGSDHRAHNTEYDTEHGDLGTIQEDTDKEPDSDNRAGRKNAEGRASLKEEEGGADGEWQDHPTRDLVEGRIDVLEGIVAEAVFWDN